VSHVWCQWGEGEFLGKGSKGKNEACRNEAVDYQHGTSVDGSLYPRT
jgi:hypothetical protein